MFGMSIRKFIILSALIVSGCEMHPETIAIDFNSGTEDYTPLVRKIRDNRCGPQDPCGASSR